MSRALGAALLAHQVEQLERSVNTKSNHYDSNNGGNHWRGRHNRHRSDSHPRQQNESRRANTRDDNRHEGFDATPTPRVNGRRSPNAVNGTPDNQSSTADVVITDASLLIHAPSQLRKWCQQSRSETVIVPLEALNTLDALKKGSSPVAKLARAASRVLEQQVGVNDRIKVQRDEAFLPWEEVMKGVEERGKVENTEKDLSTKDVERAQAAQTFPPPPEWLRRTLCCAAYEVSSTSAQKESESEKKKPRIVLALSSPHPASAPHPHANPKSDRASGSLLLTWAGLLSIPTIVIPADPLPQPSPNPPHVHVKDREATKPERKSLVERPPAALAMEGAKVNVSTTASLGATEGKKVIRLLTRGEKLEP
ncbi:hypothetical protein SISNIDRAFT_460611 [Sistotremastrum niveocremeum HHB9708]|uniref:PIN domain-containing protein n=1 Tax=Sistotremastrum niveocremeum HHB9708 TaxID=1314777 RepID=A0A164NGB2_9AGAM|nr:hypothetical protein SISNIDRAFT_460611 [Sistotremastrum niveocremeum HHB9708]